MNKEIFDKLIGHKISVLVDNFISKGRRESYVGEIKESGEDYICLVIAQDYDKPSRIKGIYLDHSLIKSIWIYNE